MKVGIIGLGKMGEAMAGHVLTRGEDSLAVFDLDSIPVDRVSEKGAQKCADVRELANFSELVIICVATDQQVLDVISEITESDAATTLVIASTVHPATIIEAAQSIADTNLKLVDSPVVFGSAGARDGNLLCLCGGDESDIEFIRPALMAFSRDVVRVGPLGHGQMAKAVNNMLHWAHCVSNFEALALAKRFGLDAQNLREILLRSPGTNGTLETWDDTYLTWQEKDMDIVMDLAQKASITMPLFGQVDQLVKTISHDDIQDLLYGDKATYIGQIIAGDSDLLGGN